LLRKLVETAPHRLHGYSGLTEADLRHSSVRAECGDLAPKDEMVSFVCPLSLKVENCTPAGNQGHPASSARQK
jgi:hypothetical protein